MSLEAAIIDLWERRDTLAPDSPATDTAPIHEVLGALDRGELRVAERQHDGTWHTNEWLKQAVLLSRYLMNMLEPSKLMADRWKNWM